MRRALYARHWPRGLRSRGFERLAGSPDVLARDDVRSSRPARSRRVLPQPRAAASPAPRPCFWASS